MVQPWYTFNRIDNYGGKEPFGNFPKPDSNIQVPDNYPVTALLPGTVSGINSPDGSVPAWGAAITIALDTPINSIATHTAYIHLARVAPGMVVGKHVNAGDLIGYNGGANAAGTQKVPLGFALYNGDIYGYGPSWGAYVGSQALNPVPVLDRAKSGVSLVFGQQPDNPFDKAAKNVAGGLNNAASTIGGGITSLIPGIGPILQWINDPIRVVKALVGILLIAVSIALLLLPEGTPQQLLEGVKALA